jgi:hypothetical protein
VESQADLDLLGEQPRKDRMRVMLCKVGSQLPSGVALIMQAGRTVLIVYLNVQRHELVGVLQAVLPYLNVTRITRSCKQGRHNLDRKAKCYYNCKGGSSSIKRLCSHQIGDGVLSVW